MSDPTPFPEPTPIPDGFKRCNRRERCLNPDGAVLPATPEYFNRNRACKDGLNTICKACSAATELAYRESHREEARARTKAWNEANPDRAKQWRKANPSKVAEQKRRYQVGHKGQIAAYQRDYRRANQARLREQRRGYYRNNRVQILSKKKAAYQKNKQHFHLINRPGTHRRRARLLGAPGSHSRKDVRLLYEAQTGRCWWCGIPVGDRYHVDHRIPLSRGGSNAPDNLCISCPDCNRSKGDKLPSEWGDRLL